MYNISKAVLIHRKGEKKIGIRNTTSLKRRSNLRNLEMKKRYSFASFVMYILLISVFCCFVPSSNGQDSPIELYYDDGTAEAGYSPTLGLYTYAVRFYTPVQNETYEVTEVSYYIYDKPSSFKMDIRDENATSIFSSIVTPSATGWFSISLQGGITVRREFYAAMKYLTLYKPQLGADYDAPDNQSGEGLYGFPAPPNILSLDYMIRAKVKPVTGTTPSFALRSESSTLLAYLAQSTKVNISIASFNGFNSTVELTVAQIPPNAAASFSEPLIKPGEMSTLTISTSYGTPKGVHFIIIFGSSQDIIMTQVLELMVVGDDPFELVSPLALSVYTGKSVSTDISVEACNEFNSSISLSIVQLPSGLTASLSKNMIAPTEKSKLTITASPSAKQGVQNLTIVGTSQNFSYALILWLTVEVPPPPVWMQSWFWILLGGVAGIVVSSSAVQYYYKKWRKAKAPLDTDYIITASTLAKLEELRLLNKISEKDYERLKKEYEQKLKG